MSIEIHELHPDLKHPWCKRGWPGNEKLRDWLVSLDSRYIKTECSPNKVVAHFDCVYAADELMKFVDTHIRGGDYNDMVDGCYRISRAMLGGRKAMLRATWD